MRIGLSYNIKQEVFEQSCLPEDAYEEFDSLGTIFAIRDVISDLNHQVVMLGFGEAAARKILDDRVDFIFNIAEGFSGRSREAIMPAFFEMLNIPYSGPDPLTAAITLDKVMANKIASLSGVNVPSSLVLTKGGELNLTGIKFPLILKPAHEGSSKGIRKKSLVKDLEEFTRQLGWLQKNYPLQPVIAEEFIQGREFTVGIIGNQDAEVLGVMEIRPKDKNTKNFIYSLEVKRNYIEEVDYFCPPELEGFIVDKLRKSALRLFQAFGCRDFARFDFRLNRNNDPCFLEVNPLPGLNPVSSDIIIMARLLGIGYDRIIERILNCALERCKPHYVQV